MLVLLRMKDCGRSQHNRAGLADGKGSSADGNGCERLLARET